MSANVKPEKVIHSDVSSPISEVQLSVIIITLLHLRMKPMVFAA